MKTQIYKSRLLWQAIVLFVLDGLFFGLTNPDEVNSLFLIVGFVLLGLSFYTLLRIMAQFLVRIGFKIKNRRKLAGFIAVLVLLLLALQSIGQLSGRDILIIVPLAILLYVYMAYIRPKTLV